MNFCAFLRTACPAQQRGDQADTLIWSKPMVVAFLARRLKHHARLIRRDRISSKSLLRCAITKQGFRTAFAPGANAKYGGAAFEGVHAETLSGESSRMGRSSQAPVWGRSGRGAIRRDPASSPLYPSRVLRRHVLRQLFGVTGRFLACLRFARAFSGHQRLTISGSAVRRCLRRFCRATYAYQFRLVAGSLLGDRRYVGRDAEASFRWFERAQFPLSPRRRGRRANTKDLRRAVAHAGPPPCTGRDQVGLRGQRNSFAARLPGCRFPTCRCIARLLFAS